MYAVSLTPKRELKLLYFWSFNIVGELQWEFHYKEIRCSSFGYIYARLQAAPKRDRVQIPCWRLIEDFTHGRRNAVQALGGHLYTSDHIFSSIFNVNFWHSYKLSIFSELMLISKCFQCGFKNCSNSESRLGQCSSFGVVRITDIAYGWQSSQFTVETAVKIATAVIIICCLTMKCLGCRRMVTFSTFSCVKLNRFRKDSISQIPKDIFLQSNAFTYLYLKLQLKGVSTNTLEVSNWIYFYIVTEIIVVVAQKSNKPRF